MRLPLFLISAIVALQSLPALAADIDWLESKPIEGPPIGRLVRVETYELANGRRVDIQEYTSIGAATEEKKSTPAQAVAPWPVHYVPYFQGLSFGSSCAGGSCGQ